MNHRTVGTLTGAVLAMSGLSGCGAPPIPHEEVPQGWTLNIHQPVEWWTQPLVPRSVIVQRCAPPDGWSSDPDLAKVSALPPGGDVEFSSFTYDYECGIGWSEAVRHAKVPPGMKSKEAGLRQICSASGLPMDAGWRFLGQASDTHPDYLATAAFIDSHGTVVGCLPGYDIADVGWTASVRLSVGIDIAAGSGAAPSCPAVPEVMGTGDDMAVEEYRVRGAGAVRDANGRVLRDAVTLRIGLAGDTVTSAHTVVDGVAIVEAWAKPRETIRVERVEEVPEIEGQVLDNDGKVLATCRN